METILFGKKHWIMLRKNLNQLSLCPVIVKMIGILKVMDYVMVLFLH